MPECRRSEFHAMSSQEKYRILRNGEDVPGLSDIIVPGFYQFYRTVMIRMFHYGFAGLSISGLRFCFDKAGITVITDHKINFETGVLRKIICLNTGFIQKTKRVFSRFVRKSKRLSAYFLLNSEGVFRRERLMKTSSGFE